MLDTSQMSLPVIILLTFIPMFVSASLLRAKGVTGLLAITVIVVVIVVIFMDFEKWRLTVGAISALVGLAVGGKVSDARELARVKREELDAARKRDDYLKKL